MRHRRPYGALLAVGAAALMPGCGEPPPRANVVVGYDVSCRACAVRSGYDAALGEVIRWTASGQGSVTVDVIDGNSLASFGGRYHSSFRPDPSLGGNSALVKDDLESRAATATKHA